MGAVIQTVQSKNTSFPQGTQFCSWLGALLGPALQGKPPQLNFSSFVQAVKLCPKLRARTGGRWRRHPPWGQNWRRHQETQKSRKYYFNAVFVKINTNAKKKKKTIFWWTEYLHFKGREAMNLHLTPLASVSSWPSRYLGKPCRILSAANIRKIHLKIPLLFRWFCLTSGWQGLADVESVMPLET